MDKDRIQIIVFEPSDLIYEGLSNMLHKSGNNFFLTRISEFDELTTLAKKINYTIAILNPYLLINKIADFNKIRNNLPKVSWIALQYSFFDQELLNKFDHSISVTYDLNTIINILKKDFNKNHSDHAEKEHLSERETDVLVLLVKGMSNKEIADKLNISIHTVISHRKNIVDKTGIKSLPGLTIYAISKKVLPFDF